MERDSVVAFLVAVLCCTVHFAAGQERRTGNTCRNDVECPDNAFCRSATYCVCKEGFIIIPYNDSHRECIKEALHGEPCREHIQCRSRLGVQAECLSGVCGCKATAHLDNERCYSTSLVGERCSVTENCYLGEGSEAEKQAFCVRGYCSCQLQHSPRDGGLRCVRDAGLGESCEDQLQCAGAGLECRQGTCRCEEGWVAHDVTRVCLQSAEELGAGCEADVQCDSLAGSAGAAMCLNGMCNCTWGARAAGPPDHPARCWHKRRPGQDCKRNEECVSEEDEQGYCRAGRCTCATCAPDARDFNSAPAHLPGPATALAAASASLALVAAFRQH